MIDLGESRIYRIFFEPIPRLSLEPIQKNRNSQSKARQQTFFFLYFQNQFYNSSLETLVFRLFYGLGFGIFRSLDILSIFVHLIGDFATRYIKIVW